MKRICALLLLFLIAPVCGHSQFIGYSSPQGVVAKPFNAVTTSQTSAIIQNLGQTIHFLNYSVAGSATLIQIRLEGSYDNSTFFPISDDATDLGQGQILAIGYYPYVRANLLQCGGCGGAVTLTANYSGVSSSPGNPFGLYNPSQQIRKVVFANASEGTTATVTGLVAPYGSSAGILIMFFSVAPPANSTVSVTAHVGGSTATVLDATALPLNSSPEAFFLPASPATTLDVTYTSGGASANTFSLFYLFYPPGGALPSGAQPPTIRNGESVSAVNSPVSRNLAPDTIVGQRPYLFQVLAHCSAGTASLNVSDSGLSGNFLYTSGATEVGTTTFSRSWNPGLAGIGSLTITLTSCGAGNTGTLDVQGSTF